LAQFFEDIEGFQLNTHFFTGTVAKRFVFDGYTEQEALDHQQCPQVGSTVVLDNKTFACTGRAIVRKIRQDAGEIVANFSTASSSNVLFKPWELTYRRVEIVLPIFSAGTHAYQLPDRSTAESLTWISQTRTIPVDFQVLTVCVRRYSPGAMNNGAHMADLANAISQVHHMHKLPIGGSWVMQPMTFRQSSYEHTDIIYTWVRDPGNTAPTSPPNERIPIPPPGGVGPPSQFVDRFIMPPIRPPWHEYAVAPGFGQDGYAVEGRPKIYTVPLYPETVADPDGSGFIPNPFFTPNGWQGLPGDPV